MSLSDRSSSGLRAGGWRRAWRSVVGWLVCASGVWPAAAMEGPGDDLTELSLEELGALSISAAAKRAQPIFETPVAVSVLLADDIRRYGQASLADALRLVPGVHVAGKNAFNWQVGIRGFNGLSSTKLLVTIDGRNIYSPYYAGVDWAEADLPVEDLARVEVVRGPGATLWGVNAVNGVINITSKSAHDTQGGLLAVRVGSADASNVFVRQGVALGARAWYRVYARRVRTDEAFEARDGPDDVAFQQFRTGLRVDAEHGARLRSTWQFDFVAQSNHPKLADPATGREDVAANRHQRASALGRMQWRESPTNEVTLQAYLDTAHDTSTGYPGLTGGSFRSAESGANQDVDVSQHLKLGERHDLVWGSGARHTSIDVDAGGTIGIRQPRARVWRYNLFAQDEFALVPERWRLTVGSKLEHHDNVATVAHGHGVEETLVSGPFGLEQSFVVQEKPAGAGDLVVHVRLALGDGLHATLDAAAGVVAIADAQGDVVATYSDLFAVDADRKPLPAKLELTGDEVAELGETTRTAMRALRIAYGPQGFNLGMNLGEVAGAGIAAHLHQHVVPRWRGDSNFLPIVARTRALPEILADTRARLAAAWEAASHDEGSPAC